MKLILKKVSSLISAKAIFVAVFCSVIFLVMDLILRLYLGSGLADFISILTVVIFFLFFYTISKAKLWIAKLRVDIKNIDQNRGLMSRFSIIQAAIALLEWLWLAWFRLSIIAGLLYGGRGLQRSERTPLIVPADTGYPDGSLGDQALLLGLEALIDLKSAWLVTTENFVASEMFADHKFLGAWDGLLAGWKLGRTGKAVNCLYIIGADVLDGYYSTMVSVQRIVLVDVFARYGIQTVFTGFSFNEKPSNSVVTAFRRLPDSPRIFLRDKVSLERFESIVGRRATLVADLAFLMPPESESTVAKRVFAWATQQRKTGRRIVGININPQVVAHLPDGTETAIATSFAECCRELLQHQVSIVLIPHDFRPGCADLRVLSLVWSLIENEITNEVILLSDEFTAREIKGACFEFDLILSARMHLAIASLSVGTPLCGIQYQGKFEGLFQHFNFGLDLFIAPEAALVSQRLTHFILGHLAKVDAYRSTLVEKLPSVVELARRNVSQEFSK